MRLLLAAVLLLLPSLLATPVEIEYETLTFEATLSLSGYVESPGFGEPWGIWIYPDSSDLRHRPLRRIHRRLPSVDSVEEHLPQDWRLP